MVLKFDAFWPPNENLPEFLRVWINLNKEINWNKDSPFNFNKAKLASVNGKVNKNFPPIANNTANNNSTTNNKIRKPLEIFFDETFVKNFIKKYNVNTYIPTDYVIDSLADIIYHYSCVDCSKDELFDYNSYFFNTLIVNCDIYGLLTCYLSITDIYVSAASNKDDE